MSDRPTDHSAALERMRGWPEIAWVLDEVKQLRQRIVSAEVALMMFVAEKPRIEPLKMMQAYLIAYPEPLASTRAVETCVAAKESGENKAKGRRVS